jgi:predicted transcriptional regulator
MPKRPRPTEAELAILRVLWRRGESTVRQVLDEMPAGTGYTTALKLMQIMAEKGLVLRDEKNRSHVYRAAAAESQTLRALAGDLLERAFGGNAEKFLLAALSAKRATPAQLAEMRRMIEAAQKDERNAK